MRTRYIREASHVMSSRRTVLCLQECYANMFYASNDFFASLRSIRAPAPRVGRIFASFERPRPSSAWIHPVQLLLQTASYWRIRVRRRARNVSQTSPQCSHGRVRPRWAAVSSQRTMRRKPSYAADILYNNFADQVLLLLLGMTETMEEAGRQAMGLG